MDIIKIRILNILFKKIIWASWGTQGCIKQFFIFNHFLNNASINIFA